jgi:thioredoxin-like negative regulator of GroEL
LLPRWATLICLGALVATAGCDSEIAQNRFVGTQVTSEQFAGTDYFDQITASDKLVIVDFTADWCGPCQQLKPLLKELEVAGSCKLVMIDADEHPGILEQFRVNGIPHLLFIKDGQIRDVHRGSASRDQLAGILQGI